MPGFNQTRRDANNGTQRESLLNTIFKALHDNDRRSYLKLDIHNPRTDNEAFEKDDVKSTP